MPEAWSAKRERQYQHIKDSQLDKGVSEDEAEEIAARTVNKTRAQEGESEEASRVSLEDDAPLAQRGAGAHEGAAVRGRPPAGGRGPLDDDQGRAGGRARGPLTARG